MSQDNMYGYEPDETNAFDISAIEAAQDTSVEPPSRPAQPEEPKEASVPEEDSDSDNLYDSVDEESENQRASEAVEPQVSTSEPVEPVQPPSAEPHPTEEDDDVSDYDPTAGFDDEDEAPKPQSTSINTQPVGTSQDENDDDEAYDPTAALSDDHPVTAEPSSISQTATSPAQVSSVLTPSSNTLIDQLTTRLLQDPTFLQLSPQEQQERVAKEMLALQQGSTPQLPQQQLFQQQNQPQPRQRQRQQFEHAPHRPDLTQPMSSEERNEYRQFLKDEELYNTRYPHAPNSRLFIGNIPSNHVQKPELWRIFRKYGKILQVSMKTAYGFVQYDSAASVEKAMAGESNIPLYNKVLNLAVAKNSRPEEIAQNRESTRKRTRDQSPPARSLKRRNLECQIFVKPDGDADYARDINRIFENNGIVTDYTFLRAGDDVANMVNDAAYGGVMSVAMVKRHSMDVQIFEETADGALRFDEYVDLNTNDAVNLIIREKEKRPPVRPNRGGERNERFDNRRDRRNDMSDDRRGFNRNDRRGGRGGDRRDDRRDDRWDDRRDGYNDRRGGYNDHRVRSPPRNQDQQNLLQSLSSLPPEAIQNLITLAQSTTQQPIPQQQYQPPPMNQYQRAPSQQNQQVPPAALNALLTPLGGQQQPQQQQQQQQQPQSGNVASLLETLAKLQK